MHETLLIIRDMPFVKFCVFPITTRILATQFWGGPLLVHMMNHLRSINVRGRLGVEPLIFSQNELHRMVMNV